MPKFEVKVMIWFPALVWRFILFLFIHSLVSPFKWLKMFFPKNITSTHIEHNEQKAFAWVTFPYWACSLGKMTGNCTIEYWENPTECAQCPRLCVPWFHCDPSHTWLALYVVCWFSVLFPPDKSVPLASSGRFSATGFPNTVHWVIFHTAGKMDCSVESNRW